MKKYKSLSLFLDYMQDFYGPTLTERNLYDPNYEHLAVTNLRFKYSGSLFNIPYVMDWDWDRRDDGVYIYFSHPGSINYLDELIENELKERIIKFGKISKNIHLYFNNKQISYE